MAKTRAKTSGSQPTATEFVAAHSRGCICGGVAYWGTRPFGVRPCDYESPLALTFEPLPSPEDLLAWRGQERGGRRSGDPLQANQAAETVGKSEQNSPERVMRGTRPDATFCEIPREVSSVTARQDREYLSERRVADHVGDVDPILVTRRVALPSHHLGFDAT
jgi:hypothetical protein